MKPSSLLATLAAMTALALPAGCTGFTLGEHQPGGDTWGDPVPPGAGEHHVGAIAVQPDEAALWVVHEENRGAVRAHLSAVDPQAGTSFEVLDVSGTTDRRVVFPGPDRMLLMAQQGKTEHLVLFDTRTRTRLAQTTKPTWYWGTRTAPSGRAVVVADNADPMAPLHVIDATTLGHQVLAHGGELVEAMWNHHADVLLALSVTEPFGEHPTARVLRYDLTGARFDAPLPAPTVVWEGSGYGWDQLFSFTWIGISPDDRYAVFPLIDRRPPPAGGAASGRDHVLLIIDQSAAPGPSAGALVDGSGPVGFTHDGGAIVSYGVGAAGAQELWLIDPASHERKTVALPFSGGVSFFPMRDAGYIAAAPVLAPGALAIYDRATDQVRRTALEDVTLTDFVSRRGHPELWLESAGALYALTLGDGASAVIPTPRPLANVAVRPTADQALGAARERAELYRFAMSSRTLIGAPIVLPSPFDSAPPRLRSGARATARLAAPAEQPVAAGHLRTRREHDGDAIGL